MSYILKHFDNSLVKFDMTSSGIKGMSVELIDIYEKHKTFFPIDLELTDSGLLRWLKRRIIPKNRAFVQNFLAKLSLNVNDTKGIIDLCKGLSLNDCHWVVDENFKGIFDEYNLYDNRFDRALSLIAYTGYGETQKSEFVSTPELTTDGMLPKCWRRMKNGKIFLYKTGSSGAANAGNEPYSEYYAFQIAETMGLKAVQYNLNKWKKQLCSTCELFTNKELSYIPTGRIVTEGGWEAVINYYRQLGEIFYNSLVDMLIFDAVICNEDRHFGNFGLIVDNKTNKIVDTAPIFDNGLSLFNYAMAEDFNNIDAYAKTRLMATSQDFLIFAKEIIGKEQKKKLYKLINFKFTKHKSYNLPSSRLKVMEAFIQKRIQELLAIPSVPTGPTLKGKNPMLMTTTHGIELCYDTFGDQDGRPLILIIGLATQMIAWPDPFCRMLADAGHFVIRFDNRDCGLSSNMDQMGMPDLQRLMTDAMMGLSVQAPYTLSDMAQDAVGLMDGLEIERAHICGMSMGGMIGQIIALEHPERLLSLVSMMSSTGERDLPSSTPKAQEAMMSAPPMDREGYRAYMGRLGRAFAGVSDLYDEEMQKDIAGQAFDRALNPMGFVRQMAAILAASGRRNRLKTIKTPTLVIHGDCDTVVPPKHGQDTADAIPGARLLMIPGLGHGSCFPALWEDMVKAIAEHTTEASL